MPTPGFEPGSEPPQGSMLSDYTKRALPTKTIGQNIYKYFLIQVFNHEKIIMHIMQQGNNK